MTFGGSPTVAVRTHHVALGHLGLDVLPSSPREPIAHVEALVEQVIELEDKRISFSAISARMATKVFDQ